MILDEFVKKYLGKKVDVDNYPPGKEGQCIDLFRKYVEEVLDFPNPKPVEGARLLWEAFDLDPSLYHYYDKISNGLFALPKRGDIPIWGNKVGGGYGHVSIVLEANLTKFKSFDQNWPTVNVCTITEHTYLNQSLHGWLRPKVSDESIKLLREEIKALRSQISTLEDPSKYWFDALKLFELPSNSKWGTFKTKAKGLFSAVDSLKDKVIALEKQLSGNVTGLSTQKDGKYIYETWDLLLEVVRRLRG